MRIFLFLDSLPQGLVWIFAVLVLVFLSMRLFRLPKEEKRPRKKREPSFPARELVLLLRRARYSPWARHQVRHRLVRILIALRTERELIPPERAWQELWSGRWPGDNVLGRFLRGEDHGDFLAALGEALEELTRYAEGGTL